MAALPKLEKDEAVKVPLDPEDALRALLQVTSGPPVTDVGGRWTSAMAQRQTCKDIWPGGCRMSVHPPRWKHGGKSHHPTLEMGLAAAKNPTTLPEVLMELGTWDDESVRTAALANARYPRA